LLGQRIEGVENTDAHFTEGQDHAKLRRLPQMREAVAIECEFNRTPPRHEMRGDGVEERARETQ